MTRLALYLYSMSQNITAKSKNNVENAAFTVLFCGGFFRLDPAVDTAMSRLKKSAAKKNEIVRGNKCKTSAKAVGYAKKVWSN
jgi:hypothetical protein